MNLRPEDGRGGMFQVAKRHRPSDAQGPSGDDRRRGLSRDETKLTEQSILTGWRQKMEELVRT